MLNPISSTMKALITIRLLASLAGGIGFYLSLFLVSAYHFSIARAGLYLSIYGLGTILGGFIGGYFADRVEIFKITILTLFIEGLLFISLAHTQTPLFLILVIFLLGLMNYAFIATNNVEIFNLASRCSSPEKSRLSAINNIQIVSNIGIGLAALLMSTVAIHQMSNIYSLAGVSLILVSLAYWCFCKKRANYVTRQKSGSDTTGSSTISQPMKKVLIAVLIMVFIVGWIIAQRRTSYAPFLHTLFPQYGLHGIGLLFALNPILIICFQAPVVGRVGKYSPYLAMALGMLLLAIGAGLLINLHSYLLAIVACVIYTFGEMLFFSPAQLLCYQNSKAHTKGKAIGAFKSIYALSILIGPFSGGLIYHTFGANSLWAFACAFGVLAAIVFMLMKPWLNA